MSARSLKLWRYTPALFKFREWTTTRHHDVACNKFWMSWNRFLFFGDTRFNIVHTRAVSCQQDIFVLLGDIIYYIVFKKPFRNQNDPTSRNNLNLHVKKWHYFSFTMAVSESFRVMLCHFSNKSLQQRFPRARFEARPSAFTRLTFSKPHPPFQNPEGCSYNIRKLTAEFLVSVKFILRGFSWNSTCHVRAFVYSRTNIKLPR